MRSSGERSGLVLSSETVRHLLDGADNELQSFFRRIEKIILRVYPELDTRLALECVRLSLQEVVFTRVCVPLFALFKMRHFYRDTELASKLVLLQDITPGDLGISPQFCLDQLLATHCGDDAVSELGSLRDSRSPSACSEDDEEQLSNDAPNVGYDTLHRLALGK